MRDRAAGTVDQRRVAGPARRAVCRAGARYRPTAVLDQLTATLDVHSAPPLRALSRIAEVAAYERSPRQ